jgi:hypothetical protein
MNIVFNFILYFDSIHINEQEIVKIWSMKLDHLISKNIIIIHFVSMLIVKKN